MKPIRDLVNQYPNLNAAALALKIHREQLKRFYDADAMYSPYLGEVWTRSPAKIILPGMAQE